MASVVLWHCARKAAAALGCRAHSTAAGASLASVPEAAGPLAVSAEQDDIFNDVHDPQQRAALERLMSMPVQHARSSTAASTSERKLECELLRLSNLSLPFEGHMVKAKVVDVDRKRVTVDIGFKQAKMAISELSPDSVLGSVMPSNTPRSPGEVRVGDIVQVYLESSHTPEGLAYVSGQQGASARRSEAVWKEIEQCMEAGHTIKGRIMNQLAGGYAVGVAGLVAFLSAKHCSRRTASRIGQLQDFKVLRMTRDRMNVVLAEPAVLAELKRNAAARMGGSAQSQPGSRRQPAPQHGGGEGPGGSGKRRESPEDIQRVADELRDVLSLRGRREGR